MSKQNVSSERMHPDRIGHLLVENEGCAVRVHLVNSELCTPLEPYSESCMYRNDTVEVDSFEAVVDLGEVADGGETVWGRLHLPDSEWERVGLQRHWDHEDADDKGEQRILEVWSSRFSNYDDFEPADYNPPVPSDSALIDGWTFDVSETPAAPLERADLTVYAAYDKSVRDYGNVHNRLEVGEIASIEVIDEICEVPERRESKTYDFDESDFSRYPSIDYDEIDECRTTERILNAVHTINRHAKRFDEEADTKYTSGRGAEARVCSLRKKALYSAKTVMIHKLVKFGTTGINLSMHNLNGAVDMWCFEFSEGYSFHQPKEAVKDEVLDAFDASGDMESVDISFNGSSNTDTGMSLDDAIDVVRDCGVDVNDHLESDFVEDYEFGYQINTTFS